MLPEEQKIFWPLLADLMSQFGVGALDFQYDVREQFRQWVELLERSATGQHERMVSFAETVDVLFGENVNEDDRTSNPPVLFAQALDRVSVSFLCYLYVV